MLRQRVLITVLGVSALLACALPAGATAAPKTEAAGTITLVSNTVLSTKHSDDKTTIHAVAVVDFAGTFTGRATEIYRSTTYANGETKQRGRGSFTGTVADRTGTIHYVFRGDATSGVISITHGRGGLRGAHGEIAYSLTTSSPTAVFSYTGTVCFR
jgi:hypothetical protein